MSPVLDVLIRDCLERDSPERDGLKRNNPVGEHGGGFLTAGAPVRGPSMRLPDEYDV
jgi:hypothetical protein